MQDLTPLLGVLGKGLIIGWAVALGGMAGPALLRSLNRISASMLLGFGIWGLAAKWLG